MLQDILEELLDPIDKWGSRRGCEFKYHIRNDGFVHKLKYKPEYFEIEYGAMYEAPEISFKILKTLSDLFGTDAIDVDDYAYEGCESCDYGSDYGHTIQIYNPTKNIQEFYSFSKRV